MSPNLLLPCRVLYFLFILEMIFDGLLHRLANPMMVYIHWVLLVLAVFVMIVGVLCLLKRQFAPAISFILIPLLFIFHVVAKGFA